MKTISTLEKRMICNLVIFLTAAAVTYDMFNHVFYGATKPKLVFVIICLIASEFASSKKEEYKKL